MAAATEPIAAWAPLRDPRFRVAWGAFLGAQIVIWAQTVGAVDVITEQTDSATLVALIQTAISLPGVALALLAGAVADVLDRRRLLVAAAGAMAVAMTALALLRAADAATPAVVLALTAALGAGLAMFLPAFSASVPDLLPRALLSPAIAITNVSVNIARAAGPALAGGLIALTGAGGLFWVLAGVLVGVTLMLAVAAPSARPESPEPIAAAVRAGARYARFSTPLRSIIARTTIFIAFGSAMWAMLPVVAVRRLDLPASGFGVLLACVGVGAVAGAGLLPRLRARLAPDRLTAVGSVLIAAVLVALSVLREPLAAGAVLLLAGATWITVLTVHITGAQNASPAWVRGRAMATWLLAYQLGFAIGGVVWGLVADASLDAALLVPAGALVLSILAARVAPLPADEDVELEAVRAWADPIVETEVAATDGPVLVTVEYEVDPANAEAFVEAMHELSLVRRRDGAFRWDLSQDLADPERFVETFSVATWGEHLRQHDRGTQADAPLEERALGLARTFEVRHLIGR